MFSIQDLLVRHAIPGLKQSETRRECAEVLTKATGITISPKAIQISERVLSVNVPPVLKSALILKQEAILVALKESGITITSIR